VTLRQRLAVAYLVLQGVGVLAWWVVLAVAPGARALFTAAGAPDVVLLAFVVGDLALVAGGSFMAAVGVARGAAWAWPVLLVHAGAAAFAGLYCVTLPLLAGGSGWVAAVAMLPVLVVPPALAVVLRPRPAAA
jgi:hypothetical protein